MMFRTAARVIAAAGSAVLLAACTGDDTAPTAPEAPIVMQFAAAAGAEEEVFAGIRRATARYHDLERAVADGFVFLHGCEERPDEGPVGMVYVQLERLLDGRIDPALPDALIYEPARNGRPKLVGVEFAVPYALWTEPQPPQFMGEVFQPEDEFGVFGLHVWVWRHNPNGMFAESHPQISC